MCIFLTIFLVIGTLYTITLIVFVVISPNTQMIDFFPQHRHQSKHTAARAAERSMLSVPLRMRRNQCREIGQLSSPVFSTPCQRYGALGFSRFTLYVSGGCFLEITLYAELWRFLQVHVIDKLNVAKYIVSFSRKIVFNVMISNRYTSCSLNS